MKNLTTKEFCRKFIACREGMRFALKYNTMRECYVALLNGEAGKNTYRWTIWTYVRAADKVDTVRFALWCAKRVRHLMTDKKSTDALDAVQRWLNGKKVDLKGFVCAAYQAYHTVFAAYHIVLAAYHTVCAAYHTVCAAYQADHVVDQADHVVDFTTPFHVTEAASASALAAEDVGDETAAQIQHLLTLGNPFEEEGKLLKRGAK